MALTGEAVVFGKRGTTRCLCLDVSAAGLAVLSSATTKVRELVQIEASLGTMALRCEAMVVRCKRFRDGYLWGLRFSRMDDQTRQAVRTFVERELANAARSRQAQLFAARMKSTPIPQAPRQARAPAQAADTGPQPAAPPLDAASTPAHHAALPTPPPGELSSFEHLGHARGGQALGGEPLGGHARGGEPLGGSFGNDPGAMPGALPLIDLSEPSNPQMTLEPVHRREVPALEIERPTEAPLIGDESRQPASSVTATLEEFDPPPTAQTIAPAAEQVVRSGMTQRPQPAVSGQTVVNSMEPIAEPIAEPIVEPIAEPNMAPIVEPNMAPIRAGQPEPGAPDNAFDEAETPSFGIIAHPIRPTPAPAAAPTLFPDAEPTPPMGTPAPAPGVAAAMATPGPASRRATFPGVAEPGLYDDIPAKRSASPSGAKPFDRYAPLGGTPPPAATPYLGDVETLSSDLTPTGAKRRDPDDAGSFDDEQDAITPTSIELPSAHGSGLYPAVGTAPRGTPLDSAASEPTSPGVLSQEFTPPPQPATTTTSSTAREEPAAHAPGAPAREHPTEPSYSLHARPAVAVAAAEDDGEDPWAQTGQTVVTDLAALGLLSRPQLGTSSPPLAARAVAEVDTGDAPEDFSVVPAFVPVYDKRPPALTAFTVVSSFDESAPFEGVSPELAAPPLARRSPEVSEKKYGQAPGPDAGWQSRTLSYLSPDDGLGPVLPPAVDDDDELTAVLPEGLEPLHATYNTRGSRSGVHADPFGDAELTAMRVQPLLANGAAGGAGFELNPRGPAPPSMTIAPPDAEPPAPVLAVPSPTTPSTPSTPSTPAQREPDGHAPTGPHRAVASPSRTLVEQALAQLKAKTEAVRSTRPESEPEPEPEALKAKAATRRRRRRGAPKQVQSTTDPKLEALYQQAIEDLENQYS